MNEIEELIKIEAASAKILEEASFEKRELSESVEKRKSEYDRAKDAEVESRLAALKEECKKKKEQELAVLMDREEKTLRSIIREYVDEQDLRAQEIVEKIIGG